MATELAKDQVEQLAFDVAQEYFNDEQLCIRYSITIGQLKHLRQQPAFIREVDEVKRVLEDGGEKFIYAARRKALGALKTLDKIRRHRDATLSQKAAAANAIIDVAGVKRAPNADAGAGIRLSIHTNLALGNENKGVYSIELKPAIEGEAQRIVEEAPRKLKKLARIVDDGSDLL
jgi:hypothetical protein